MEKVVRHFDSVEAAEAADIEEDLAMPPEQRVLMVLELQARVTRMQIGKDLREFIDLLNANRVKAALAG